MSDKVRRGLCPGLLLLAAAVAGQEGPADVALRHWTSPPFWSPAARQENDSEGLSRLQTERVEKMAAPAAGGLAYGFVSIVPCRQYDSRNSSPLLQGTSRSVPLTGAPCNIPSGSPAVSVNISVFNIVGAAGNGVFSVGIPGSPSIAWINYPPSQSQIDNSGVVPVDNGGNISAAVAQGAGSVNFVVDVNGYYTSSAIVNSLNGLVNDVTLMPGTGVTITPSGQTLTIDSSGLASVSHDGTLTGLGTPGSILSVAFGGTGVATTAAKSDHDHFGAFWSGNGSALRVNNTASANPAIWGIGVQWGVQGNASSSNPVGGGVVGVGSTAGGNGVFGDGGPGNGVKGSSTGSNGVFGTSSQSNASGVYGENTGGGFGIAARSAANTGAFAAIYAENTGGGLGILGQSGGTAVWARSLGGTGLLATTSGATPALIANGTKAAEFNGDVDVFGTLTKSAGSFRIDHPLDPANKYLSHSFVESPDMMNIYNGLAILDASGEAVIEMPSWFEALNRDFRYQLTCVGGFAPVYVADEVAGSRFRIAGGRPGLKVSWQVTGIRHDAYANAHRIPVEQEKPPGERGRYLQPDLFGQTREQATGLLARSAVQKP